MNEIIVALPFNTAILTGQVAGSTLALYQKNIESYFTYAGSPEKALEPSTLARWRNMMVLSTDLAPGTINNRLAAIRSFMNAAAEQGYVTYDLAQSFDRIKDLKKGVLQERGRINNRVRISPEEMRSIVESIEGQTLWALRTRALFLALASSGLRVNEFRLLTYKQIVKRDNNYVLHMYAELGKNQLKDREALISIEAVEAIETWREACPIVSDYIFLSFQGRRRLQDRPISSVGVWRIVRKITELLELENVKPHDFRRFVGGQLMKENPELARKALGHANMNTTILYDLEDIEAGKTNKLF